MTKPKPKHTEDLNLFEGNTAAQDENLKAGTEIKAPTKARAKRGQVERIEPSREVVPVGGDLQSVLATFERLAVNPAVNPDSLGKLLDVQERLLDRRAKDMFDAAVIAMQTDLPPITKDGHIAYDDKPSGRGKGAKIGYAKWETIDALVKPILKAHGLGLTHRIGTAPDGRVRVTAVLRGHGHTDDSCYFDLQADSGGGKNNVQAWASSVSYAKRHTACAVLNIITKDEDDDAKASGRPAVLGQPLTTEQLDQLVTFRDAVECPAAKLVAHLNQHRPSGHPELEKLDDLPTTRFDEAIEALRGYEANAAAKAAKAAEKK